MDEDGEHTGIPVLSTHTVGVTGPYGSVSWMVSSALWSILPVKIRVAALDSAGPKVIDPFFEGLTARLLEQVDRTDLQVSQLAPEWSLEEINADCTYGTVVWAVSQGLWDALPADSREGLIEMVKALIHEHFHVEVDIPLMTYAYRKLHG